MLLSCADLEPTVALGYTVPYARMLTLYSPEQRAFFEACEARPDRFSTPAKISLEFSEPVEFASAMCLYNYQLSEGNLIAVMVPQTVSVAKTGTRSLSLMVDGIRMKKAPTKKLTLTFRKNYSLREVAKVAYSGVHASDEFPMGPGETIRGLMSSSGSVIEEDTVDVIVSGEELAAELKKALDANPPPGN